MQEKNKEYSLKKHRIAIIEMISTPIILGFFIFSGLATYFKALCTSITMNDYINLLFFLIFLSGIYLVLVTPLRFYSDFMLEHKYSLSNQTVESWFKRELKRDIISFVIALPLVYSLYLFIRYYPSRWWLYTGFVWIFVSVVLVKFAPVIIIPIFYKYSPIKNTQLKDRLVELAQSVGFSVSAVYEINISKDTKKANAALLGLGKEKRIVLCDTLLSNFTEKEIEVVMAHELGHHKLAHTLKLIAMSSLLTIAMLFITDLLFIKFHEALGYNLLYEFESLVLIALIISMLNILVLPLGNLFSRMLERSADMFSLKMTCDKDAFISTMKKLAEQNLANVDPGKFYEIMLYDHPPISRRISFAEKYGTEN